MWEKRCYFRGIPDECPPKLAKAMRVPSYKAIAMAILKNDLHLTSLGFSNKESNLVEQVYKASKIKA
jgi:predicted phosphoadenosine phosphosulfate sulfurtransferase